ncbi:MAG: crossover junction endodeoxyribonuclease RuvC [Gammaproteobacteria bacterium]|nr:crossover junction endodeoxyribonuclease RuvC [Gammaproteobacteria bacterium]
MTKIMGIDPGSRITGYGLVDDVRGKLQYIDSGCIRTTTDTFSKRLLQIFDGVCELMQHHTPDEVVIEQIFTHQNPATALKLGQARGAALVAAASFRVEIAEYTPRQVKLAVVGYGAAEKEQVKQMVMRLLGLQTAPQTDASDALALAICHSHQRRFKQLVQTGLNKEQV